MAKSAIKKSAKKSQVKKVVAKKSPAKKVVVKKTTAKKTSPKKPATKPQTKAIKKLSPAELLQQEKELKISEKWNDFFKKGMGETVLFKEKLGSEFGWGADDSLFLRGKMVGNEIFAEDRGWYSLENSYNAGEDVIKETKVPFNKVKFDAFGDLWIFDVKKCLVFPHTKHNEKLANEFNALMGEDLKLQNQYQDIFLSNGMVMGKSLNLKNAKPAVIVKLDKVEKLINDNQDKIILVLSKLEK